MDAKTYPFRSLIAGPRQYLIPPFQRAYSWDKPERETLWLDLLAQYERLSTVWHLPDTEREERLASMPGHYLGTLVLAGPTVVGVPKSQVIDGQQRITTLLIALAALRDVRLRQMRREFTGQADLQERLDQARRRLNNLYLINADTSGLERWRLVPQARDERAFIACMNHDGSTQLTAASVGLGLADSPKTLQAYQFFFTELRRQRVDEARQPQLMRFESLFPLDLVRLEEAIAGRLSLIAIETRNADDVNAIFESLNAKGKPLSQLDLLRNYIFMMLRGRADEVLNRDWRPMETNNLPDPAEVEQLAWAHLVSHGRNVLQNRTYRTVQALLRERGGNPDAAEAYVAELSKASIPFAHLLRPTGELDPALQDALIRLNKAGGRTSYPVALWLYRMVAEDRASAADVAAAVRLVEAFLVRRFLVGLSPNNLNSMFGGMLSRIHARADYSTASPMSMLAAALTANPKEFPSDADLELGIQRNDFYNSGKASQRTYILSELDRFYHPGTVLNYSDSDESIEHILVQAHESPGWEADLRGIGEQFRDTQERYLHSLGNLTLVEPGMNSRLGAKRFVEKVAIFPGSPYPLTSRLALDFESETAAHTVWGQEAITARARELARIAAVVWPRPAAAAATTSPSAIAELDLDENEEAVPFTSSVDEEDIAEQD